MKVTFKNKMRCLAIHNDRDFEVKKDSHIDISRMHLNVYGNIYNDDSLKFKDLEMRYYKEHYSEKLKDLNQKAIKNRHPDQVQTMSKYMQNHGPEELLLQIGGMHDYIDPELFKSCVKEFIEEMENYSSNCHILDWAIHLDEKTPHAHIRKVWDYTNENGILEVNKGKALKELGIELPYPQDPLSRDNNRSMTFDAMARQTWMRIAEEHGFIIEKTTEKTFNPEIKALDIRDYKEEKIKEDQELVREWSTTFQDLEKEYKEKIDDYERKIREIDEKIKEQKDLELSISQKDLDMSRQLLELESRIAEANKKYELIEKKIKEQRKELSRLPRKSQKVIENSTGIKIKREKELEIG